MGQGAMGQGAMGRAAAPVAEPGGGTGRHCRPEWIYGAATDLVISLCWIPLFAFGHQLSAAHGPRADSMLRWAVTSVLLVSFLHQPLTMVLVYGDRRQFRQRRRLFTWAPPITVAVLTFAVILHLWLIVPIAALWNTVHTLQQRYGISRIYARRSGYGSAVLDRWVLYSWMAAAALFVAAKPATLGLAERVSLDTLNTGGVRLLTDARPIAMVALVPIGLAAIALAGAIVRQEATVVGGLRPARLENDGPPERPPACANPAKWIYQSSSLLLIASIAIDPAAGFIAYVGAHAIEYAVVVYKTTESRYGRERDNQTLLGCVAWRRSGRVSVLVGVSGIAFALTSRFHGNAANVMLYTFGALHFLYDGFIWKLRKPVVAADFAIRV